MPEYNSIEIPLQGTGYYYNDGKSEYIKLTMADGGIVILKPGKDGFFDENFDALKKYALNMKRLLDFLEEKAKKNAESAKNVEG
jgi:hypothetical protein